VRGLPRPPGRPGSQDAAAGLRIELPQRPGVEVWSDFKRHAVRKQLWDRVAFDNSGVEIMHDQFMTPPLWDVANTAPYMHDGSAATLEDAIYAHGGEGSEASSSLARYWELSADDRAALLEFLSSLGASSHN
jgi:CxxC motif-containing protein (DUF1111 family)